MNPNFTMSEIAAIIGKVSPQSLATSSANTGLVPIKDFLRVQAVISVGVISSTGVVNAKLQGAVGSGGSPVDIPGAAITALTQAGTDSNKVAVIDLNLDALAGTGYTHLQLVITDTVAAALVSAELIGWAKYSPPIDGTFVDEIVTVG